MTRRPALALLLLLLAAPAWGACPTAMLLPTAIERKDGGWMVLGYEEQTLEPGEACLVMLCLRTAEPLLAPPALTVLPSTERHHRDKIAVLSSTAGFFPVGVPGMSAYVTYRIENLSMLPLPYIPFLSVRGGDHGDHGTH